MSFRLQVLSGIKWTSASAALVSLLQLMQLAILARFLSPSDYGLMAIMMVVIGFAQSFTDMGISNSIIHRQNITPSQLSSLYWVNIFAGVLFSGLIVVLAPLIAVFYEEPRIESLLALLSLVFVITAFGNQYRVLCQKEMQFERIAKIKVVSVLVGLLVSIPMAIEGFGVYSLIVAALAQASVSSLLFMVAGLKEHHRPQLMYRHSELKGFFSFGLFQMAERSVNYFNTQFDVILIGRLLGAEATGIYHIAKNLVMRVINIINPIVIKVTLPLMAKIQNDDERLKRIYLKTVNHLSLVSFPVFMGMAILAEPLVTVLFGPQWSASVFILQILAFYSMLRSVGNPVGTLLLAKGRADLGFYWNFALFLFVPLVIYIGSYWGLKGVALAQVLLMIILMVPGWFYLVKPLCGAGLREYVSSFGKPLSYVLVAGCAVIPFTLIQNMLLQTVATLIVGACIYMVFIWKFNKDFLMLAKELAPFKLRV